MVGLSAQFADRSHLAVFASARGYGRAEMIQRFERQAMLARMASRFMALLVDAAPPVDLTPVPYPPQDRPADMPDASTAASCPQVYETDLADVQPEG